MSHYLNATVLVKLCKILSCQLELNLYQLKRSSNEMSVRDKNRF